MKTKHIGAKKCRICKLLLIKRPITIPERKKKEKKTNTQQNATLSEHDTVRYLEMLLTCTQNENVSEG